MNKVITPEEGGSVTTADGDATVEVPTGAVTNEFVVVDVAPVEDEDVPPVPGALRLATGKQTVEISFRDTEGNLRPQFRTQKSIKVTLKFDDGEAALGGGGQGLKMLKFDRATQQWITLPTTVDLRNMTISAFVRTFSLFSVGVPSPEMTPTPTSTPTSTPTPTPTPSPSPTPTPAAEVALPATGGRMPSAGAVAGLIGLGVVLLGSGSFVLYRRRQAEA